MEFIHGSPEENWLLGDRIVVASEHAHSYDFTEQQKIHPFSPIPLYTYIQTINHPSSLDLDLIRHQ